MQQCPSLSALSQMQTRRRMDARTARTRESWSGGLPPGGPTPPPPPSTRSDCYGDSQRTVTALRFPCITLGRGGAVMTEPGDERTAAAGGGGHLRVSRTDRERVIELLKD